MEPSFSEQPGHRTVIAGRFFVLIAAFGFSAKAVLIKLAYGYGEQVDAITLMTLRMAMALPFFLGSALWLVKQTDAPPLTRTDWATVFGLGLLGYYLASFLDFSGLTYISAGLERLILFLYPTLVVLLTAVIDRRMVRGPDAIALMLSYAGIVLVFLSDEAFGSSQMVLGAVLVLGSAVSFAVFMVGSGVMVGRIGSARLTAYSMTVACLATGAHFGVYHDAFSIDLPADVYGLALVMAVASTVMPAFLMNAGIGWIGSSQASIISSAGPVATLVLAYLILDETMTASQLIGSVLVLSGVWAISRPGRGRPQRQCKQ